MKIKYSLTITFLCAIVTSYSYADVSVGRGETRTEACALAKERASRLSDDVSSSCDCSVTDYGKYVCSVDWESRHHQSSYERPTSDRSSPSSSDDTPSRFQQTTPPGQRFVPVQIPQRGAYNLGGMP